MSQTTTLTTPWGTKIKTTRSSRYLVIVQTLDNNGTGVSAHIERGSNYLGEISGYVNRKGRGDWTHRRFAMDRLTGMVI